MIENALGNVQPVTISICVAEVAGFMPNVKLETFSRPFHIVGMRITLNKKISLQLLK